jgi:heme/copper-type cytochrome/quinol oxidase subunit 2
MNGITFILTVALAAAFVLLVVGLVVVIIYYRYRLKDSHRTLARFIKENILLREENEKKTISQ